jgi:butyryl-CoA dehydrogenase/acyl-CoA dehydrogenase
MPGFSVGKIEEKMGIRASGTAELLFDNVRVPKDNLIGKEGDGFKIAMMTLDKTRPTVGAQAIGVAQGALDCTLNYLRLQTKLGNRIAERQAVQFMLADMETQLQAARYLVYVASDKVDKNAADKTIFSAMSKLYATDAAVKVTATALQITGPYGCTNEYPVERMDRDARIFPIVEGTNEVQRLVVAREMLRRGF